MQPRTYEDMLRQENHEQLMKKMDQIIELLQESKKKEVRKRGVRVSSIDSEQLQGSDS